MQEDVTDNKKHQRQCKRGAGERDQHAILAPPVSYRRGRAGEGEQRQTYPRDSAENFK